MHALLQHPNLSNSLCGLRAAIQLYLYFAEVAWIAPQAQLVRSEHVLVVFYNLATVEKELRLTIPAPSQGRSMIVSI